MLSTKHKRMPGRSPRAGHGAGAGEPAAANDHIDFCLHAVFWGSLVFTAVKHLDVVIVLGMLCAQTAAYAIAVDMKAKLNKQQRVLFVGAVVLFGLFAVMQSPMNCSTCLEPHKVTLQSIDKFMLRFVYLEDLFQQMFGKNSDVKLSATKEGVVQKWPKCYDAWKDTWDPCKVFEATKIELTCRI